MAPFSTRRAFVVFLLLALALAALAGRVLWLQTAGRDEILAYADRQQHSRVSLQARRGSIFDRNGLLLAGTVQRRDVFVDPAFLFGQYRARGQSLLQLDADVERLAETLDLDPGQLMQDLSDRIHGRYLVIARDVSDEAVAAVTDLNLPGVGTAVATSRYYPMGALAAHVLGGTGANGQGLEGLELALNETLSGTDGSKRVRRDGRRRPIGVAADDYLPPEHGRHVVLTLDANIQLFAEDELAKACIEFEAESGQAVVLDPKTGDVLALANWPRFNPQNLADSQPDWRRNRALTDPYEPGSTLKPMIVAAALDRNLTHLAEVFETHGPVWRTAYGRRITDVHPYPKLNTWDVLVKSSNIGMSMLGNRMGNARLREALWDFGMGRPGGIELPGEAGGLLNPLHRWTKYSTESICQGYEMLATPLQMARATAAIANNGRLVEPHVVSGVLYPDGTIQSSRPEGRQLMGQAVRPQTARDVLRVLADVPVRGTGRNAKLAHWTLFGKTGTAHKAVNGAYDEINYTASFVGGAPYENPRLVIAFIVHKPNKAKSHFGGIVAAPAAARILERSLAYLNVPPSPDLPPYPSAVAAHLYGYTPRTETARGE
ncbi:MAG: peptidoglycan D,D-transpeptidase FtsI family protein [Phycisphaerae bacterium]